jgi:hypothetical protein
MQTFASDTVGDGACSFAASREHRLAVQRPPSATRLASVDDPETLLAGCEQHGEVVIPDTVVISTLPLAGRRAGD